MADEQGAIPEGMARAKQRRADRDASGIVYVDGSIYEGMEACLVRSGVTIAHVVKYADAVDIAAALATPAADRLADTGEGAARNALARELPQQSFDKLRTAILSGSTAFHSNPISWVVEAAIRAIVATPKPPVDAGDMREMATAPRNGAYILAVVAPGRGHHLEYQAGRAFVIRHGGMAGEYDLGWSVYPGFGGCSDHDFLGWFPLPNALSRNLPDAGEGVRQC